MPRAEITSYKPTSRYLCACPDLDYSRFADFRYLIPFTLLKLQLAVRYLRLPPPFACRRLGGHHLHAYKVFLESWGFRGSSGAAYRSVTGTHRKTVHGQDLRPLEMEEDALNGRYLPPERPSVIAIGH